MRDPWNWNAVVRRLLPRVVAIPVIILALALYSNVGVLGSTLFALYALAQFMLLGLAIEFVRWRFLSRR